MRNDMQSIVGDTRRSGGHGKFPKHRREQCRDIEALPTRESMGKRHTHWGESKVNAFRVAPLRRWLNAQVGRPWSKVVSELSSRINRETSAGRQAWEMVDFYVTTDVYIRADGVPMERQAMYRRNYEVMGFYVNPQTGLLCRNRRPRNWREERRVNEERMVLEKRREIGPNQYLLKYADHWFLVELATVPEVPVETDHARYPTRREEHIIIDALIKADVTSPDARDRRALERRDFYGSDTLYAKTAKQANHQEMKRYGIFG